MLKQKFGAYGEMKQFFDLISTRGLIFITYVSTRACMASSCLLTGLCIVRHSDGHLRAGWVARVRNSKQSCELLIGIIFGSRITTDSRPRSTCTTLSPEKMSKVDPATERRTKARFGSAFGTVGNR